MQSSEERSYIAFISYRHKPLDKQAAELIQQKIEHYKVPKEFREKIGSDRLGLVFRDEDELPAGASLSGSITYALDHSQYMIVICTPDLPKSEWCEKEIRYFLETHDRDHIIAVLVDGEPAESFSPLIRFDYAEDGTVRAEVEPLAANIDGPGHTIDRKKFRKEIVRVYAALLQCPFDALWQREKRYQTTRLAIFAAAAFLVMAVFLGVVIRKNLQITQQNRDLEYQKSSILVTAGQQQLEARNIQGAIDTAHQAMQNKDSMPYDHRAQALLVDAVGAYSGGGDYRNELVLEQTSMIVNADILEDGRILTADQFGMVRCYDRTGQQVLWTASSQNAGSERFRTDLDTRLEAISEEEIVLCINGDNLKALSLKDGSDIWDYPKLAENSFFVISSDRTRIALIDFESPDYGADPYLVILSAAGEELFRLPIREEGYNLSYGYSAQPVSGGAFSDNGTYLSVMLAYSNQNNYSELLYQCYLVDVRSGYMEKLVSLITENDYNTTILGMHVSDSGYQTYVAYYDGGMGLVRRVFLHRGEDGYRMYEYEQTAYEKVAYTPMASRRFVPCVYNDQVILTVFNNTIYIDDWVSEEEVHVFSKDEPIYALDFSESDPAAVRILLEDGNQLEEVPEESWIWQDCDEHVNLRFGRLLEERWEFLYTTLEEPNRLMKLAYVPEDPNGRPLAEGTVSMEHSYTTCLSPSGSTLFMFAPSYEKPWPMDVYSAEDWSLKTSLVFDPITESLAPAVNLIDDESIMIGLRIYHTDGTVSYLENFEEDDLEISYSLFTAMRSVTLADGTVVSITGMEGSTRQEDWKNGSGGPDIFSYRGFVNGKQIEDSFRVSSGETYVLGKNGLLITFGFPIVKEEDGYIFTETESCYYIWNIREDERITIPNGCPLDRMRKVAPGTAKPIFAVADSEGGIRIYSTETKDSILFSDAYSTGPVRAMSFFAEDAYLAVFTYTGRLDIFDVESKELVFSEEDPYATKIVDRIDVFEDGNGRLLLIGRTAEFGYGNCIVIDQAEWALAARIPNVFIYSKKANELLTCRGEKIVRYPLYSADELLNWGTIPQAEP